MIAIDVRALSKLHGATPALMDVTFSVPHGTLVAVTGPPRSGKSTLLKLLAGTFAASGGRIRLFDLDVRHDRLASASAVGVVPQGRSACTSMPLSDVLHCAGRARRLPATTLDRRIAAVVDAWGLTPHLRFRCDTVGPAVQRRIDIAVASLHAPRILLLDEPLTGLDPVDASDIVARLEHHRGQTTTMVATAGSAPARWDRCLTLEHGRLVGDR